MSAIRLLVLGAVRQHGRAHGYQVRNDLEYWGAHEWSNAKPGSIYHALKQMAKQGLLLRARDRAQHGRRPAAHRVRDHRGGHGGVPQAAAGGPHRLRPEAGLLTSAHRLHRRPAAGRGVALLKERIAALEEWRQRVTRALRRPRTAPDELGHIGEIMNLWVHTPTAVPSGRGV